MEDTFGKAHKCEGMCDAAMCGLDCSTLGFGSFCVFWLSFPIYGWGSFSGLHSGSRLDLWVRDGIDTGVQDGWRVRPRKERYRQPAPERQTEQLLSGNCFFPTKGRQRDMSIPEDIPCCRFQTYAGVLVLAIQSPCLSLLTAPVITYVFFFGGFQGWIESQSCVGRC